MRTFIALDIPDEVKSEVKRIQTTLKILDAPVKWVHPEDIHITLKFLGNINEKLLPPIQNILTETATNHTIFTIKLTSLGCFPNPHRPRILFIDTDQQERLEQIVFELEKRLEGLNFTIEKKFQSHITIARCKLPQKCSPLIEQTKKLFVTGRFSANALNLYKSTLTPKGPIYENLFKAPFHKT